MVVLVRRFDPTGEELARWEVLVRDEDGRPEFFSPPKAKAAALAPPRNADLHIGDLIATMPAEAAGHDEYATGLYVVAPDGVKDAPSPPEWLDGSWLARWGQNSDRMLLSSQTVSQLRLAMAAVGCAETALHLAPNDDAQLHEALQLTRSYCTGPASYREHLEMLHFTPRLDQVVRRAEARRYDASNRHGYNTVQYVEADQELSVAKAVKLAFEASYCYPAVAPRRARDAVLNIRTLCDASVSANLAAVVERWIPLPVVLLSTLGYPNAIPFDPSAAPTSSVSPRENPRHPSRRMGRR
jgi:hypothetical protein